MKYLVDTNIWLEVFLNQEKSEEAAAFLKDTDSSYIFISDFSLHSILLILTKFKKFNESKIFLEDLMSSQIIVLSVHFNDLKDVISAMQQYNLDFDDAYQYFLAKKYNLILISFDRDFDKTDILRKTPVELIK